MLFAVTASKAFDIFRHFLPEEANKCVTDMSSCDGFSLSSFSLPLNNNNDDYDRISEVYMGLQIAL